MNKFIFIFLMFLPIYLYGQENFEQNVFFFKEKMIEIDSCNFDLNKFIEDYTNVILPTFPQAHIYLLGYTGFNECDTKTCLKKLSKMRVKLIRRIILQKGIRKKQIKIKFYGGKEIRVPCNDKFPCDENRKKLNYAVEVKFVS